MRKIEVRHIILVILDPIQGALPESTLQLFVNLRIRPKADDLEFKEALNWLTTEGFINSLKSDLDHDLLHWFITERGIVVLRK